MGKIKYLILKTPDKIGGDLILNPDMPLLLITRYSSLIIVKRCSVEIDVRGWKEI